MRFAVLGLLLVGSGLSQAANLADAQRHITRIKAVAKEGEGNQEAGAAWRDLVALGVDALLPTLSAMNDASPTAANWLRSAVNAVVEKEKAAGKNLPADRLEEFVRNLKHAPAVRRLAYEVLADIDPKTPERLLPGMINDPSYEIRHDAVAAALVKAEKLDGDAARKEYGRLFSAVRDKDQARKIATAIEKLGTAPNLVTHFGFVTDWMIVGPFDSPKGSGFDKSFEPESRVDLKATYTGKGDAKITWKAHSIEPVAKQFDVDEVGMVDLNKVLAKHKDAVAYAFAVIESDTDQPIELRFGCINAIKVFHNGKPVFAREEYHHGQRFDQYVAPITLKAGKNELLVKVTQNDQKESWAQVWQFQLRLADATGGAAPVRTVSSAR